MIDVVGGKKRFREILVKQLIRLSGQPLNENQLRRAVANEMRRMDIAGAKLDGTDTKRFLVFLDETHIKGMPNNLSAADKAKYAVEKLNTVEKIEALELGYWRTKLSQPGSGLIKGSYPYLVGLIGALFQYHAMAKLGEDEQKAMSHETVESRHRLGAGMAAFWGTVADLVGQGVAKVAPLIPKVARGMNVLATGLKVGGRFVGIIGAGMVAYWDYQNYERTKAEGQVGMAVLYLSSAVLGFSAASFLLLTGFFAWAGPLALILVGLLIAVAVLIEYFKDNKIQEWLKRCWWGNGPDAQYPDVETEMKQLERAVA